MSIVTLKRKSRRFQAHISGKQHAGFSLQGGRRNQGWVGQGVRGRSLTGTSFRGVVARGAGGTNGAYPRIINNKGACCTNDPSVIKRTTMTTKSYIDSIVPDRFHDECMCPLQIWVKDFSPLNHSQSSRIAKVAREEGAWGAKDVCEMDAGFDSCTLPCGSAAYHIGGKKYMREMYAKKLNYLEDGGEIYQRTGLMQKKNLPPPAPCKVISPLQTSPLQTSPLQTSPLQTSPLQTSPLQTVIPDIIIGSGYGVIPGIPNNVREVTDSDPCGNRFADISNVSWMLQLDNSNLLMNNELGTGVSDGAAANLGELYIINNSGVQQDYFNLTSKGLGGPVYFCKYGGNIYVACYGGKVPNTAGIYVFSQNKNIETGTAYQSLGFSTMTPPASNIHMIDIFTPTGGSSSTFLLAVDLGSKCIYKITPGNVNFNTKVYDFGTLFPRHFVQIPNTNYIALITERGNAGTPQTLVMILEYNSTTNNFSLKTKIDLGNEFVDTKKILKGITGAEIKYINNNIYVTVRGYVEPYKGWQTLPANGLFVKLVFDGTALKIVSYVGVGKDPRYFTIKDNFAYVANHLGIDPYNQSNPNPGDISIININNMNPVPISLKPGNIYPIFILLK